MRNKILLFLLITMHIFCISTTYASIQKFDQKHYTPINYGLKDLVFEIQMPGLLPLLKEKMKLTNLEDIYFRIYWILPNIYRVEVNGLPEGFIQLRTTLTQQIHAQMEYIIPRTLTKKLEGYEMKTKKEGKMTVVMGIDKTGMKDINEVKLFFNNSGQLVKTITFSPMGIITSNNKMLTPTWSQKKFVISEKNTLHKEGMFTTTTKTNVKYGKFKNFGFPKELLSITKLQSTGKNKKKRTLRMSTTRMKFRNYIINQGIAKKYIDESNKKK